MFRYFAKYVDTPKKASSPNTQALDFEVGFHLQEKIPGKPS